jgi:hypothetical protein
LLNRTTRSVSGVQPDNIIGRSVVCGLGLSPKERISIKNGEVQEPNFYGYTVMRNRDVPEIHVEVVATTITRQAWDCSPGCTLRITGVPTGRDAPTKTHQRARRGLALNGSARSASSR